MRGCPSCRREWRDEIEVCPRCLASLVDDLGATITCRMCGRECPSRMQTCPGCLALLRAEDVDVFADAEQAMTSGSRARRPAGKAPFADGPSCTVLRLAPRAGLVVCGADGLVEASLIGRDIWARPPLVCAADDITLFTLEEYMATADAMVAIGEDGAPIATYLRDGGPLSQNLIVRDGTSAPVARFSPMFARGFALIEVGGGVIAEAQRTDVELDEWVDDQWSVQPVVDRLPFHPLALVGLAVAAKVLLGRAEPEPARLHGRPGEPAELWPHV